MTSRLVLLLEVKASFLKGSLVLLWLSTRIPGSLWLSTQIPGSLCRTSPVRVTETAIANFKWPTTQGAFGTSQYSFWVPFFQEIKLIMTTGNAPSWAFQEFKVKKRHGRIFYLDHLTWQSSTLRPELVWCHCLHFWWESRKCHSRQKSSGEWQPDGGKRHHLPYNQAAAVYIGCQSFSHNKVMLKYKADCKRVLCLDPGNLGWVQSTLSLPFWGSHVETWGRAGSSKGSHGGFRNCWSCFSARKPCCFLWRLASLWHICGENS